MIPDGDWIKHHYKDERGPANHLVNPDGAWGPIYMWLDWDDNTWKVHPAGRYPFWVWECNGWQLFVSLVDPLTMFEAGEPPLWGGEALGFARQPSPGWVFV